MDQQSVSTQMPGSTPNKGGLTSRTILAHKPGSTGTLPVWAHRGEYFVLPNLMDSGHERPERVIHEKTSRVKMGVDSLADWCAILMDFPSSYLYGFSVQPLWGDASFRNGTHSIGVLLCTVIDSFTFLTHALTQISVYTKI